MSFPVEIIEETPRIHVDPVWFANLGGQRRLAVCRDKHAPLAIKGNVSLVKAKLLALGKATDGDEVGPTTREVNETLLPHNRLGTIGQLAREEEILHETHVAEYHVNPRGWQDDQTVFRNDPPQEKDVISEFGAIAESGAAHEGRLIADPPNAPAGRRNDDDRKEDELNENRTRQKASSEPARSANHNSSWRRASRGRVVMELPI